MEPLFLLSGLGMMLLGGGVIAGWQRGRPPLWRAAGLGATAWALSVALKFAWAIPFNEIVRGLADLAGKTAGPPLFWLYIGLLTGVFECCVPLVLVRRTRLKSAGWDEAVAFGIGFGAMEAFLLGAATFTAVLVALVTTGNAQLAKGLGGSLAPIPLAIAERAATIAGHCFACVLILYGVRAGQRRWFWLSFAYKTGLDGFAAWAILAFGIKESLARMARFEAAVAVFGLVALAGLVALKPRFARPAVYRAATGLEC